MKYYYGLICCFVVMMIGSASSVWYPKDEFMQHYQTLLVHDFPRNLNNRTIMTHWCQALTSTTINDQPKAYLSGMVYHGASGVTGAYIAPNQSILAYMLCHPYVDRPSKIFPKALLSSIKTTKYTDLIEDYDSDKCDVMNKSNTLARCPLAKTVNDIAMIMFDDLFTIAQGASYGYVSPNEEDIGYMMAQHFASASGNKASTRIQLINKQICMSSQVAFIGSSATWWCNFPNTLAQIQEYSNLGKSLVEHTRMLDGPRMLLNDCDVIDDGTNIIGCGINHTVTTQSFVDMVYNELWVYQQRLAMYQTIIQINPELIKGGRQGLSTAQTINLVDQTIEQMHSHWRLMRSSIQQSTVLLTKLASSYHMYIGILLLQEAQNRLVTSQYVTASTNYYNYIIDRLNTQAAEGS